MSSRGHGERLRRLLKQIRRSPEDLEQLEQRQGINASRVDKWLSNFKEQDQAAMLKLALSVQRYQIDTLATLINGALKSLVHDKQTFIRTKACYLGIGKYACSSGNQFLHSLKKANPEISEARFQQLWELKNCRERDCLVLVDDFMGSGTQASEFFNTEIRDLHFSEVYYVSALGSKDSADNIRKRTEGRLLSYTGRELVDADKAFSQRSSIWEDDKEREKAKKIAKRWGEKLYPDHPLGKGDCQYLIVFQWNVPWNTLPVIWSRPTSTVDFIPLCPRYKDDDLPTYPEVVERVQSFSSAGDLRHILAQLREVQRLRIDDVTSGQRRLLDLVAKHSRTKEGTRKKLFKEFRKSKPTAGYTYDEVRFRLHALCNLGLVDYEGEKSDKMFHVTPFGEQWLDKWFPERDKPDV